MRRISGGTRRCRSLPAHPRGRLPDCLDPYAELYNHAGLSHGLDADYGKTERNNQDIGTMSRHGGHVLNQDPYYNPNLSLNDGTFDLAFPPRIDKPWGHSGDNYGNSGVGARSQDAKLVSRSGLFDRVWYLEKNKDVQAAGLDPLVHYLRSGAKEGRDPHPLFDSDWYLPANPDVAAAGLNPLVHYVRRGAAEGRAPHPAVAPVVLTAHPEVQLPNLSELRGLKPRGRIAVVLHLYYPDLWNEMRIAIERIPHPYDLFVTLVKGTSDHIRTSVTQAVPRAYVFDFENRGRDVGPFLVLLQSGVLFRYDLVCKLHTKRSPHRRMVIYGAASLSTACLAIPSRLIRLYLAFSPILISAWSSLTGISSASMSTGLETRSCLPNCCRG